MRNPFLKTKKFRAPIVKDKFPVFDEFSDERRHMDFVAGSTVQYSLCNNVTGSDARCGTWYQEICNGVGGSK
jgi:hypothetical protein